MEKDANVYEQTTPAYNLDLEVRVIKRVIAFLTLITTETLAKRIVSIVLLAIGTPDERVTELTGLCGRSVRTLRKIVKGGDLSSNLFQVGGGGRKSKLKDVESEITKKIEANNYHSQQEIADMVKSEYGIAIHRSGISRLLKKTALKD